ncbi:43ea9bc9-3176-47e8-a560-1c1f721e1dcc [Sclerotinia trifoliorum]|uniref:43ea9bc9-3176-47e8-a560-1c1f721e1dcc n=1 Tax=Sclerotinia trifoliorum TaxID=28548 RepID=A0A8H2ZUW7_9HELO|nr:43ea9bc9-3176-47e8-a560-1c1f721e1dcc [Sclerotinia trifoliorum]
MMIIMKTSDLPPPPRPPPPPVYVGQKTFGKMSEDANEQHKVLQVQFLAAKYKSQLCETNDDQQTNFDISDSKTVTMKVTAQQINSHGNNCIFICRYLSIEDQDQDQDPDNDNDLKLPKVFIAKEFGENKDELVTYEHLVSLQGVYIPKCFGEIQWKDKEEAIHQGFALEFLEGFRSLENINAKNDVMYWKYKKALEVIGSKEVFHGDIAFRNLMWHPEIEDIRVIDFEYAKILSEELKRDGSSIQKQNFIDLESIFDVKDSDIIREYLPTIYSKPIWMLDPPVVPSREILEQFS